VTSRKRTQFGLLASLFLMVGLACNAVVPVQLPTATQASPTRIIPAPTETLLSQQVALTSVPFSETDPGGVFPTYTITYQTPQLTGSDDARVLAFNQFFADLLAREVDTYRKNFQQLPLTNLSNGSTLNATFTLVSQMGELWSFKFDFSFYADTAAHPGLSSLTVTYDLGQARPLSLDELFLPNSNYLNAISNYCLTELKKQPYFDDMYSQGALPTAENYRNWNLAPNGLLITFDTYQVGPGAAGPQSVIVPYAKLSAFINSQGPLAGIVP